MDKKALLGKPLSTIIPNQFQEVHLLRVDKIVNFSSKNVSEVYPSLVLHQNQSLPLKGKSG